MTQQICKNCIGRNWHDLDEGDIIKIVSMANCDYNEGDEANIHDEWQRKRDADRIQERMREEA